MNETILYMWIAIITGSIGYLFATRGQIRKYIAMAEAQILELNKQLSIRSDDFAKNYLAKSKCTDEEFCFKSTLEIDQLERRINVLLHQIDDLSQRNNKLQQQLMDKQDGTHQSSHPRRQPNQRP